MKKRYNVLAMINSLPVMFPNQFIENYMRELEKFKSLEEEIDGERKYLNHLFHYKGSLNSIKKG